MALQVVQTETDQIGFSFSSSESGDFNEYRDWCAQIGIALDQHDYTDASGVRHYVAVGRTDTANVRRMKLRWGSYQQP